MVGVLGWMGRISIFPLWGLWKGYLGLWWAFDDATLLGLGRPRELKTSAVPPVDKPADQAKSFEVVDTSERTARPKWLLLSGFVSSLLISGGLGLGAMALRAAGHVSPERGVVLWGVGTLLGAVGTILAVRHTHRQRIQQKRVSPVRAAKATCEKAIRHAWGAARTGVTKAVVETAANPKVRDRVRCARDVAGRAAANAWTVCRGRGAAVWKALREGRPSPKPTSAAS